MIRTRLNACMHHKIIQYIIMQKKIFFVLKLVKNSSVDDIYLVVIRHLMIDQFWVHCLSVIFPIMLSECTFLSLTFSSEL